MRVALIQMPVADEKAVNLETACREIRKARDQGADLAVLPEMFCCPYDNACFRPNSEADGGPAQAALSALAQELGVNPNTVQKAYQLLERDGIIYSVPGKGSFIAEAANALSQQREQAVEKLRDAAGRALDCGLSLEEAQNCVKEVYEGGRPAVNQQEGSDGHD